MNLFNRVVFVVLLLVLLAAAVFALLVPATLLGGLRDGLGTLYETVLPYRIMSGAFWAYLGSGLAIIALCVLLLWLELRPTRRKAVEVADSEGRTIQVSVKAITQRLQSALNGVADVRHAKPKVTSRGKKADVHLDVEVDPATDLRFKTEEITGLAREVIQTQLGVAVGKVHVDMRYAPEAGRAGPRPAAAAAAPSRAPGASPVALPPVETTVAPAAQVPAVAGPEPVEPTPSSTIGPSEKPPLPPA